MSNTDKPYRVLFPNGNTLDVATHREATDVLRISIGFYEQLSGRKITDNEFEGWEIIHRNFGRYSSFML